MYITLPSEFTPATTVPDPGRQHGRLAGSPHRKKQAVGTHLFREGDAAACIYEITSGVFRLSRVLDNGQRQVIAFGFPGDTIGFPNGTCHHTDCEAITASEVIAYRRPSLESVDGDYLTHQRLMHAALREISAMQDHVMMLARKSAKEKVASFLVTLTQRTGTPLGDYQSCTLPMSRTDIADFLGLTVETVSRTLTSLRKENTIALESTHRVIVRDMRALVAASQVTE